MTLALFALAQSALSHPNCAYGKYSNYDREGPGAQTTGAYNVNRSKAVIIFTNSAIDVESFMEVTYIFRVAEIAILSGLGTKKVVDGARQQVLASRVAPVVMFVMCIFRIRLIMLSTSVSATQMVPSLRMRYSTTIDSALGSLNLGVRIERLFVCQQR